MRAGAGRAEGLTDVVRAQLERWQDHPNTGRDARVGGGQLDVSLTNKRERLKKRREKKETAFGSWSWYRSDLF